MKTVQAKGTHAKFKRELYPYSTIEQQPQEIRAERRAPVGHGGHARGGVCEEQVEVAKLILQRPVVVCRLPVVELSHEGDSLSSWRPLSVPALRPHSAYPRAIHAPFLQYTRRNTSATCLCIPCVCFMNTHREAGGSGWRVERRAPNALLSLVLATVDSKVLVRLGELVHAPLSVVDVRQNVLVHVPAVLQSQAHRRSHHRIHRVITTAGSQQRLLHKKSSQRSSHRGL